MSVLSGCSGKVGPADGRVIFEDGSPVQAGSIEFRETSEGKRYASRIGLDGTFHLVNEDGDPGLPQGDYEIVVVQVVITEDLAAEHHTHGNTVPQRYADYYTSDLKLTIESGKQEDLEVVVKKE